MKRRTFIATSLAVVGPIVLPLPVWAAARPRPWLIAAVFTSTKAQSDIDSIGPFRVGLGDLGYVEGRDFTLIERYADGEPSRIPSLASELAAMMPDLFLTAGPEAPAVANAAPTIPVVVGNFGIGVLSLVGNLARPAGNV